jgi:hypothetical protein
MYISHKSNVLQTFHETEWQCRRNSKGLDKSEYWTWLATITTQDDNGYDVITYPSEDFTIVECTDEDVQARLAQLGDYVNSNRSPEESLVYNIKWSDSKVSAVTGQDMEGNDIVIDTHFSGDDTTKDARLLADKWVNVRRNRDRKLAETDYLALSDSTLASDMKTYRQALRDVPADNADPDDISWPTKP